LVSCFRYKLGSDARSDTLAAMVRPLVVAGFWLAVVAALALTLTVNGWWVLAAVVLAALDERTECFTGSSAPA
jgi:hypothetical protein